MKKSIYYVVEKELEFVGGFEETTGNKTVTTYNVEDGKIVKFFDLDVDNSDNSIEAIIDYLIDNGHTEEDETGMYDSYYKEFDFIQL